MNKNITLKVSRGLFNSKYLPLLGGGTRYLVLYGGAGSGKSVFAVQRFLLRLLSEKGRNLLVVRAVSNTNRDSTFAAFKQVISSWGLYDLFPRLCVARHSKRARRARQAFAGAESFQRSRHRRPRRAGPRTADLAEAGVYLMYIGQKPRRVSCLQARKNFNRFLPRHVRGRKHFARSVCRIGRFQRPTEAQSAVKYSRKSDNVTFPNFLYPSRTADTAASRQRASA